MAKKTTLRSLFRCCFVVGVFRGGAEKPCLPGPFTRCYHALQMLVSVLIPNSASCFLSLCVPAILLVYDSTLNPDLYTVNPKPYTLSPDVPRTSMKDLMMRRRLGRLFQGPQRITFSLDIQIVKPSNPKSQILKGNPEPQTLNPQP